MALAYAVKHVARSTTAIRLLYCRFHFASNCVNICVRAWHERYSDP